MYMKNLKPIIFTAHSELKKAIPSIKKSHLYEAFAAFCGFKSYAAFQVATNFSVVNLERANRQCFERVLDLGFDAEESLQVCQRIQQAWEQFNIISLDDVYAFYAEASFEEALSATRMLNALTSLIDENDADAMLVGFVITAQILAEYEENPDNRSGEYWYNKKLVDQTLNQLQSEAADRYQKITPYRELFQHLLTIFDVSEGPVLHCPRAIEAVCQMYDDSLVRQWTSYFSDRPSDVIDAIIYVLNHHESEQPIIPYHVYLDWIKAEMLLFADREGIVEIIEAAVDDEEKWFWHIVGLEQGIDVTASTLRAVHAYTGEDYDDYGPMSITGDEGLSLPSISDNRKAKLQAQVNKITN